ncbi:MAG: MauE/DoxX family redox-associated membrane protein [Elainellaceae cyanobacterium]
MSLIQNNKDSLRGVLAVCMVVAGVLHFAATEPFVKIVPGVLPYPAAIVYVSGVIEIALGVMLLFRPLQRLAGWGLVLLFIAVYPANINMAVNQIHLDGIPDSPWVHAVRLPFQFVLIAWAYWYTRLEEETSESKAIAD